MKKYNIPIFQLKFPPTFISAFERGARKIFKSDAIAEGDYVREFEKKFSALVHAKHAIAVTSGTSALEIALRSVDVRGKLVLMPTNTFFATSVAATNAGAKIGLVDIESETLAIDPHELGKKIKQKGLGAVVLVHIGGIISRHHETIARLCRKNRVPLIEDAAHAHGSYYKGAYAGTIGDIGCFSFFPTKVMTTGEGGMLTTNNKTLFNKMRSLKNFGRALDNAGICVLPQGSNYKISEFTGLLGVLECGRVKKRMRRRNELVQRYVKNLAQSHAYTPMLQQEGRCPYYKFILRICIPREYLREYCKRNSVALTGEVYKIPIHKQPIYAKQFRRQEFPVTNQFCKNHICPPLYPELTNSEVDYVCKVLINAEKDYKTSKK